MKRTYRISSQGRSNVPTDTEVARYRDTKRLLHNYQKAVARPRVPMYRDPKAFIALLLIVLLAWFLSEAVQEKKPPQAPDPGPVQHP